MSSDDGAECPTCGQTFSTETRMRRHSKSAHGSAPSSFPLKKVAVGLAVVAVAAVGASLVMDSGGSPGSLAEEFAIADDPRLGNESANVTVVAFESPACPACRAFHHRIWPGIQAKYVETGRIAFYYSQFPAGYAFDKPGGIAQQCVYEREGSEAFFNFTDALYGRYWKSSAREVDDHIRQWSRDYGANPDPILSCYSNQETAGDYDSDVSAGEANGVRGTPYFFVWGSEGSATATGARGLDNAIQEKLSSSGAG